MGENHQQAPHKKEYPPPKTILPVLLGRISILNFFLGGIVLNITKMVILYHMPIVM